MSNMKRLQAYKFELRPDGRQERQMRRFAGSCRFVFNKALALQEANHGSGGAFIGYVSMAKLLTGWRHDPDTAWLSDAPVHSLQHALKDLERAYKNFFEGRADRPQFKKKSGGSSFRYPDSKQFKIDQTNSRVFLPKLGWMRYRNSRDILGVARNLAVSCVAGKWFASIQTAREVVNVIPVSASAVGIDVGIARFATLSDGTHIDPLNSFRKHEARLAKYQRRVSHIKKHSSTPFSRNWSKAKAKVQQMHRRIANVRRDFLHKTSTAISKNHAMIVVEDLKVSNMSRSAKGSAEVPGKNVRAKSGLNKSILDQGWAEFRRQLDYKAAWNGGYFIAVPPRNTSRTCPCCGHVSADNRRTQARFECVDCGYANNADLVGAINILSLGMMRLRDEGEDTADASAGRESASRIACQVNGAARPSAAGTRRSDLGVYA